LASVLGAPSGKKDPLRNPIKVAAHLPSGKPRRSAFWLGLARQWAHEHAANLVGAGLLAMNDNAVYLMHRVA